MIEFREVSHEGPVASETRSRHELLCEVTENVRGRAESLLLEGWYVVPTTYVVSNDPGPDGVQRFHCKVILARCAACASQRSDPAVIVPALATTAGT